MSEATADSLLPASSSSFSSRCTSRERCRVIAVRARVRSRSWRIGSGGMNEALTRPCAPSWASQVASATSVLRPRMFFTCRALTSSTSNPASSNRAYRAATSGLSAGLSSRKSAAVRYVVRRPQQVFSGGDPAPGGKGALAQLGHPPRGRLPFPLPTGQVTILDPGRGGQHLAQIGPEVAGEPGRAQRLKGKGLIVEQELHRTPRRIDPSSRCGRRAVPPKFELSPDTIRATPAPSHPGIP
jgi:hypothetical protein